MSYQKLSIIEHEPTVARIILGGAVMTMLGVAVVLIVAFGMRWMRGCWK